MKKESMNKKTKSKIALSLLLASAVTVVSIGTPFIINQKLKPSFNNDHSNTFIGNKNKVDDFITNLKSNHSSTLLNSLKVHGITGLIGEDNEDLTNEQISLVTIEQCYKNGMFTWKPNRSFQNLIRQYGIKYVGAPIYVKPNYLSNSSNPIVGIKIYSGSGSSYYESILEYRETGLYGFKKNNEQLFLNQIVDDIIKNPNQYFQLNEKVGKVGQIGLYAKSVKNEDFDQNIETLVKLKNNNFFVSISSIKVDPFNRSNLKIYFDLIYNNGITTSYKLYNEAVLNGFDVEEGVDDPESVLNKFLNDEKEYIKSLNQFFTYEVPNDESKKITSFEAYKNNEIKYEPSYSVDSKLDELGIKITFEPYEENQRKQNVFNFDFDSTTPMYRLYVSSYVGTPYEYTKDVVIEGKEQQGDFIKSSQEENMNKFVDYLDENGELSEYFIEIDWATFKLENEFANVTNITDIPFSILNNAYQKHIENDKKYKLPFSFKVKANDTKLNSINDSDVKKIVPEIVQSMNDLEMNDLIDSIEFENSKYKIKLNVSLGKYQENLFIGLEQMIVEDFEGKFAKYSEYSLKQLEKMQTFINQNNQNVICNLNDEQGQFSKDVLVEMLRNKEFNNIFSTITLINVPNIIEFTEYDSEIEVSVDLTYFNQLSSSKIEDIIKNQSMEIGLIISKKNTTNALTTTITKSFNDLINGN